MLIQIYWVQIPETRRQSGSNRSRVNVRDKKILTGEDGVVERVGLFISFYLVWSPRKTWLPFLIPRAHMQEVKNFPNHRFLCPTEAVPLKLSNGAWAQKLERWGFGAIRPIKSMMISLAVWLHYKNVTDRWTVDRSRGKRDTPRGSVQDKTRMAFIVDRTIVLPPSE